MDNSLEESRNKSVLREDEAKSLLKKYDIPTTNFIVLDKDEDPDPINLPFPLVAKVCSSEILHKTDVDGVILNIENKDRLIEAVEKLRKGFPDQAILLEPMEKGNVELIVGITNDSVFGLTIMFGLGGVLAELYKDVTFRTIPIDDYDANEMMSELKGSKILEGFRGIQVDRKSIKDLLLKVSHLGEEMEDRLEQLDLNPVLAREDGLVVVDAKVILKG
jgi:acyl-CoA synthetase (NDP forming)